MKKLTNLALMMCVALSTSLKAEPPKHKLSEFKFGKTIIGEKPTKKYLKGKVVVIEYWGTG